MRLCHKTAVRKKGDITVEKAFARIVHQFPKILAQCCFAACEGNFLHTT